MFLHNFLTHFVWKITSNMSYRWKEKIVNFVKTKNRILLYMLKLKLIAKLLLDLTNIPNIGLRGTSVNIAEYV